MSERGLLRAIADGDAASSPRAPTDSRIREITVFLIPDAFSLAEATDLMSRAGGKAIRDGRLGRVSPDFRDLVAVTFLARGVRGRPPGGARPPHGT
jgi:hypothetical protein